MDKRRYTAFLLVGLMMLATGIALKSPFYLACGVVFLGAGLSFLNKK